ncbi:hypothetical protein [Sulfurovum sp.]|uniref:hypothetical protein n=1 Tax=Sulfurovum sp. TaxID=1969726 RepID=UPI002867BFC9|nr:hypothetical protein [Sulfurovum sp.]
MEAFKVSPHLEEIMGTYPDAKLIHKVANNGSESARIALARLWLSEGIPYAFKNCPGVYEEMRSWMGSRLSINPKEISISGSARLGQSLAPQKLGKKFDEKSDLDIFIVSHDLFERLKEDYNKWAYDFESGALEDKKNIYWKDNLDKGQKNIYRGFIDSHYIPSFEIYKTVRGIQQTMYLLTEKLKITPHAPTVQKASVRCYKSWNDYVNQVTLNLKQ